MPRRASADPPRARDGRAARWAVLVPNLLTLSRVPLAIVMWIAPGNPVFAFTVMAGAGLSDVADGWFARWVRRRRWERGDDPSAFAAGAEVGAWLDPVCDKIFVVSTAVAIYWAVQPPLVAVLLVMTREILDVPLIVAYYLVPGPWRQHGYDFTADPLGKATTVVQFIAMALAVLRHPALMIAAWASAAVGLFAVGVYVARAFSVPRTS